MNATLQVAMRKAIERACDDVAAEAVQAAADHGLYHSAHEAYGVLAEEVAEFFEHVRRKRAERDNRAMRAELIQVAAVAVKAAACLT